MRDVCAKICHADTFTCVTAERVVMNKLEGGCQVPIGAYARLDGDRMIMDAIVGSVDGDTILRAHLEGPADEGVALGEAMVEELRAMGAEEILSAIRAATVDSLLET